MVTGVTGFSVPVTRCCLGTLLYRNMSLHVQAEMIRPAEGAFTEATLEGSVSSVFTVVTGELVRAGELPATTFPLAHIWLLSSVCSHMCLEV